jgi:hypothetical protein
MIDIGGFCKDMYYQDAIRGPMLLELYLFGVCTRRKRQYFKTGKNHCLVD